MTTFNLINLETNNELIFDDFVHAHTTYKHYVNKEKDGYTLENSNKYLLYMHVTQRSVTR